MPVTLMWGERGLIATFFMDLSGVADCARWIAFLKGIQFVPPGPGVDWARVQTVWAVVEPGFGSRGFGHPDAVFCLKLDDGGRVVILLEAKLCPYQEACWSPVTRGRKGFNSRLNGQLELNHCLTLALATYQPEHQQLIDPAWVLQTPYVTARPRCRPRRVKNVVVRQQLVETLVGAKFLHVIVTKDQENPLLVANQRWLPEIFVDGEHANEWNAESYRFGWINWNSLYTLGQNWPGPPARFPENLEFNLPYEFGPGAGGGDNVPPAPAAQELAPDWPPGLPAQGVSLIFAPAINNQTFLHFSWRGNGCRLRNYISDLPLAPGQPQVTMQVLGLIMHEERCGARRPRTNQIVQWRAIIQELNGRYGLGN